MGIEKMPEFKPGDIIDLSRFNKNKPHADSAMSFSSRREKSFSPENWVDFLKTELKKMATEVNSYFSGFLDGNGKIAMVGRESESDMALVKSQEDAFSRDFYGNPPEDMNAWRLKQESKDPSLTEMALTLLLHKFLKKDFIIARASDYDDYNNGVDNVLIDKQSGEVLCGFDEVMLRQGESRSSKKEEKLKRLMSKGGARLKYGAYLENGQLARATVNNIPAFYISLDKQELLELMSSLKNQSSESEGISDGEKRIFQKLISSLEEQLIGNKLNEALHQKSLAVLEKLKAAQQPSS